MAAAAAAYTVPGIVAHETALQAARCSASRIWVRRPRDNRTCAVDNRSV